jgi:hypothetical protein
LSFAVAETLFRFSVWPVTRQSALASGERRINVMRSGLRHFLGSALQTLDDQDQRAITNIGAQSIARFQVLQRAAMTPAFFRTVQQG